MDGEQRREEIIRILSESTAPVAGTELAGSLKVSRQIIVQDIALLRAVDKNILSTNKGYILFHAKTEKRCQRTLKVRHTDVQMQDELYTIVDFGGKLLDVVVEHPIYGQIMVDLIINSRQDVDHFLKQIREYGTKPLNELTDGIHFHTIEADSEEILDHIETKLKEKKILVP